ncbi:MAG TPA: hypothetical protein VH374_15545 [Polyangia bacterium]|nr:hypothetical protein [Polyangia bacterium]
MKNGLRVSWLVSFLFVDLVAALGHAQSLPAAPTGLKPLPTGSSGGAPIAVTWNATPGATSYVIYRSLAAGGETAFATSANNSFVDTHVVAGPPPVYFYKVAAVNAAGTSAMSAEEETPTPLPVSTGSGKVAGVKSGNGMLYFCKDGLRSGFDWFQRLADWFPSIVDSSGSSSPGQKVVDMAYSTTTTLAFNKVVVPSGGLYTIDWRYAFTGGLFKGVNNRQMGLMVNGAVVTRTQRFPITGSFDTYKHSALQARLNAGTNSVVLFSVTDHGISRVDELTVTPATASVPPAPTKLSATASAGQITLSWTGSAGATQYQIYRGTMSDGEDNTPIAITNGATTTHVDAGMAGGTTYFYNVSATNSVGVSADSNEVAVVFGM